MSFLVRIREADAAAQFVEVDTASFWIGAGPGSGAVELAVPELRGPLVEVRGSPAAIEVRAEPGLPIEVEAAGCRIGARYEPILEGEPLRVGTFWIDVQWRESEPVLTSLDTAALVPHSSSEDLAQWFESLMALADRLDGVRDLDELVCTTLEAVLKTTGADRCYVAIDSVGEEPGEWFQSHVGGNQEFGVSRSLIKRVRSSEGVVFVPESSSDPEVAGLLSVRREGISSSLAVPLRALGGSVGVLYADCIEPGRSLRPADFQKAALLGRMLAGAIGNRKLVRSVLDRDLPLALRSRSPACKDMIEQARLFAPTDYTILIRGETGAGKEVMARGLHELSNRASGPFVAVNCAAIPTQLMESELFGHVKGSFTGAVTDREGFFVAAQKGTLFLDEIGDMEIDLQAKILRALEAREVTPVGGSKNVPVDVRILAATHRDLEGMVEAGDFREDLYYRLRELEVRIPPLRERPEDILQLAEQFVAEAAAELSVRSPSLAPDAVRLILEHSWKGNVRELRHAVRTALLRARTGELRAEHLELAQSRVTASSSDTSSTEPQEDDSTSWKERLDEQEREALRRTLEQAGGNLTKAAAAFGLARTTYRERLLRFGLLPKS